MDPSLVPFPDPLLDELDFADVELVAVTWPASLTVVRSFVVAVCAPEVLPDALVALDVACFEAPAVGLVPDVGRAPA
jgi:hypothetical protein